MGENSFTSMDKVKQLIDLMKENGLTELEVIEGESKISLKRPDPNPQITALPTASPAIQPAVVPVPSAAAEPASAPPAEKPDNLVEIKSPIVGTFYPTPTPDADPFVSVGDSVSPETVVCIIEAMKVMNEIKAECSGKIESVMCKAGEAIEYGQVLYKVNPSG